jgi:magnesium chelatase family protein
LREPLETGRITISRAMYQTEFPARFQLVAAMNPCPCGQLGNPAGNCRCTPESIARYQGRLSGPLIDRIDLQVEVPRVAPATLASLPDGESSAVVAARVAAARARQFERQQQLNASLGGESLDLHCRLAPAARDFMHNAASRLGWSARGHHRVLRVARSAADLAGCVEISIPHLAEAIQFRRVSAAN